MDSRFEPSDAVPDVRRRDAEESFRESLLRSHRSREFLGEDEDEQGCPDLGQLAVVFLGSSVVDAESEAWAKRVQALLGGRQSGRALVRRVPLTRARGA